MTSVEQEAWIQIAYTKSVGPVRWRTLLDSTQQDSVASYHASFEHCASLWGEKVARTFVSERTRDMQNAPERLRTCESAGISFVTLNDAHYPPLLREIHDAPPVLFYRGALPAPERLLVSVVGTRLCTSYGDTVTRRLVRALVGTQIGVVSGLAFGIDAAAHEEALRAQGYTLAVLPGGLDDASLVPPRHRPLAQRILVAGGALVSECPPGTPTLKHSYPIRNRLIAGLSKATVIVEAALASGTMHTAQSALTENRELFAVPGPITSPVSAGPNCLLRDGAIPILSEEDLLHALGKTASSFSPTPTTLSLSLTPDQLRIYGALSAHPTLADDLARQHALSPAALSGILTHLELSAHARMVGHNYWVRA